MISNNIIKRSLFLILLSIIIINAHAQTGLNFQGVARATNNVILASQAITIKLSILQGSTTGTADYVETRKVMTNAQGLFTAVIGDTGAISTLGNFTTINWKLSPKFLKIEMDAAAGTNFITMGTTQFQYVAYAQFAKSVDAENIVGIVPVTLGGTGVSTIAGLKTALTLNNVNNTTDLAKPISTLTQTALDLKLNAADTSKYSKQTYLDSALVAKQVLIGLKLNAVDTIKYTKQTYSDSALVAKQVLIGLKLNAADTIKYTKQTYNDSALLTKLKISDTTAMLSSRIARDTLSLSNRIDLKGNAADITSGLALKENATNKSTAVDLGGTSPSDILFPTQKAVKDYVAANNAGGGVADGGITTIKIADAAVTDAKINTVSGSKVIGNITGNAATATLATTATTAGNITATSNTTLTSLQNLNTVGTITSGVWSGTAVAVENGGTGATTASAARTNLGLEIGTNVQAPLVTGTDYLAPTGSAASLTNFPTFNQNTSGNATTATTAGTASTATKLATARNINGALFDGSADILIPAKFTNNVTINLSGSKSLGKYANGSTIPTEGKTLDEFLLDLVTESVSPIYNSPTVSISSNKSASYEIGTDISTVTLSSSFTQNNGGAATLTTYLKGGVSLGAGVSTNNHGVLSTSVSYSVTVTYGQGPVLNNNLGSPDATGRISASSTSSSLTISPFAYKYWGSSTSNSIDDATLRAGTNENSGKAKSSFNIAITGGTKYFFYTYPASLGALSSISIGGFESFDAFTLTTRNVVNASGHSQSYNIYISNNRFASDINNIIIN